MMTSFGIDEIVFNILSKSEVKQTISGGIYYQNDRPDDSADEDVVINTISMTQDFLPQIAASNVNIYVSDVRRRIKNKEQLKPNRKRLSELTSIVLKVLREAKVDGLTFIPQSQILLQEPNIKQHFVNIRISWNIQID